ncbi:MAG: hypothetical protein M1834_007982 [Cirrosporium novae-zelandiae]|nr:MAG: hypothetical protein M1834_007982 [Cirrosporium novae-zelandiae]
MGSPADHLPLPFSDETILSLLTSLSLPPPTSIKPLKVTAAFHLIYVITYPTTTIIPKLPPSAPTPPGPSTDLILRISGDHIAKIKTENEAAVLSWVRENTSIPVPDLVSYDAMTDNPLGREYILFTRCPGQSLADVFRSFSDEQMDSIIEQVIDILLQLHKKEWTQIGGLQFSPPNQTQNNTEKIIPGPVLEETFWFLPDIEKHWPATETFSTLNISGPFNTYIDYITAHIRKYMHAISIHPTLEHMRDTLPKLEAFLTALPASASTLNKTPLRLAHKDLHYANILVDPSTAKITAILDWEFAGVVPFPRWNPTRAFLWNAQQDDEEDSLVEKADMFARFEERCGERGVDAQGLLADMQYTSKEQEQMQIVANFLRAIVEVCPRGERGDAVKGWRESMLGAMKTFGV